MRSPYRPPARARAQGTDTVTAGKPSARFWRTLLVALSLVNAAPLWAGRYLPFTDLPEHVAAAVTLRHWFDPVFHARDTYALAFGKSQYLAYHVAGALLDVTGEHPLFANRILLTAVAIALPFALRSLLRAYQTDERLALLACPLFWCRPLVIGFLPYMAALPVLLFALSRVVRQLGAPTRGRACGLAALALLVFYLHLSAYAVLLVVSVVLTALPRSGRYPFKPRRSLRDAAAASVWLVPSLIALGAWALLAGEDGGPALLTRETAVRYVPQSSLGLFFAVWTHDVWVSHFDEYLAVAFWVVVVWLGAQRRSAEPGGILGLVARATPFACVLVLYLAVPFKVGAGAMLNVRLGVLMALLVLVVPRPDPGPTSRWAFVVAAGLTVLGALNAALNIHRAQRELGDVDAVLAQITPGARVLALHFSRVSAITNSAPWVHVLAYHRMRAGGVASMSFSEMSHWPIQYQPAAHPPKKSVMFWDFEPCLFRNSTDGAYYDVIVARGDVDPFANDPPGPRWKELRPVAAFRIFERLATEPLREDGVDVGPCATPAPPVP